MGHRQARALIVMAWLAAVVVLLLGVRQAADVPYQPQPAEPLDFSIIQERFADVRDWMRAEEVYRLLGPPRPSLRFREPEFDDIEAIVEAHPDRYPGGGHDRHWVKWSDPADEGRWVAVLMIGQYAHHPRKKGF